MGDPSNIGMMEGAFFIGRSELITWLNDTLQLNVTKVEQCCTGTIYAQIIDAAHPGKVAMSKLKWGARTEPEYIHNFKVLQQAFNSLAVNRAVDVQKLVRGKYQDNLEMLQWIRAYFDRVGCSPDYDPVGRRGKLGPGMPEWVRSAGLKENVQPRVAAPRSNSARDLPNSRKTVGKDDNPRLKDEIEHLRQTASGLERERDFYFGKLRDIEIHCQNYESGCPPAGMTLDSFMSDVMKILYATDDDEEDVEVAA
jgi:RP/EB family microtubule-associated protein